MKHVGMWIAVAAMALTTATANAQEEPQSMSRTQLLESIDKHEDAIDDSKDAIKEIEKKIKEHKEAIKDLEKQKKELEKQIKAQTAARKTKVETHDNKVFDEEVMAVLMVPYSKSKTDEALKKFNGMETKEVLKKKDLVKKYGDYTKDLCSFLISQKSVFEKAGWQQQTSNTQIYKEFEKGLRDTKYFKIYNKKATNPSIPFLDEAMDKVYRFRDGGLKNKGELDSIINMLHN